MLGSYYTADEVSVGLGRQAEALHWRRSGGIRVQAKPPTPSHPFHPQLLLHCGGRPPGHGGQEGVHWPVC
jgi:hypothetical protein